MNKCSVCHINDATEQGFFCRQCYHQLFEVKIPNIKKPMCQRCEETKDDFIRFQGQNVMCTDCEYNLDEKETKEIIDDVLRPFREGGL